MSPQQLSEACGLAVSDETLERLEVYKALVEKWNPRINLVAKASLGEIWPRHIIDSAQIYRSAPPHGAIWADLGSGGGFPGVVLAVLSRQVAPHREHHFIEADQRKAVFLREAVRILECRATVISDRIEHVPPIKADLVTARALAPLPVLLGMVARHLKTDGVAILPKGAAYQDELLASKQDWEFDLEVHSSVTDPNGHILRVAGLRARAEDRKS